MSVACTTELEGAVAVADEGVRRRDDVMMDCNKGFP